MASDSDDDYQDNFQESDAYVDSGDDSDFEAAPPTKKAKVTKKTGSTKETSATKKTAPARATKKTATKKMNKDLDDENDEDGSDFEVTKPAPKKRSPNKSATKKTEVAAETNGHAETPMEDIEMIDVSKSANKNKSIEEIYQKKSQLEHILLRPDTYVGSTEVEEEEMWVFDSEQSIIKKKKIKYVPGLYKIVDEILVNAADHKIRDPAMTYIKVTINRTENFICIENNGKGIPITEHKKEKVYVPELIFGHLLTSSNYDDEEKRVVGGRNGYGAKLCNVFSTEFTVETADKERQLKYKQIFQKNMTIIKPPSITKNSRGEQYTRISFKPDLAKFSLTEMDEDFEALIKKRVYDLAGCVDNCNVFLNGTKIPIKNFKQYCELYTKSLELGPDETKKEIIFDNAATGRWQVCFALSDGQFDQISFVNSICTAKGGTHVNHVADQIVKHLAPEVEKKSKNKNVKNMQIKNHMVLFIKCLIENPTFETQTKETMTIRASAFGSSYKLSDRFANAIAKSGIVDNIVRWVKFKEEQKMSKVDKGLMRRTLNIPKLEDANFAGVPGKNKRCTLIITEGDSAKSLVLSGMSVVGRDYYGVFPIRGKLLNVRDVSNAELMKNEEIKNIKAILGLQHGKKYESVDELRYGRLMIMTDQDHDGSHIKGLIINFIDSMFPSLLDIPGFLLEFITPIIKCTHKRSKQVISFFTIPEYEQWALEHNKKSEWEVKYFKGLGTSDKMAAREYFSKPEIHQKEFQTMDTEDRQLIDMVFNKKKASDRKEWLTQYEPGIFIDHNVSKIKISEFVNRELMLFSMADNIRSIPSVVDGFKPAQRKVLYGCIKRPKNTEVKVAQLANYVAGITQYHHGEQSVAGTIINMAQNFVGSNNINLLVPSGQFGNRHSGSKSAASPRYLFTRLSKITRLIFHPDDDAVLNYLIEEDKMIEPSWYIPIIPMVLVNGADGIGTGWSTAIPNYNPKDIIDNILRLMNNQPMEAMKPWYRGFKGEISPAGPNKFAVNGIAEITPESDVKVTEIPVRLYTEAFKKFLLDCIPDQTKDKKNIIVQIQSFKDNSTDVAVDFTIKLDDNNLKKAEDVGLLTAFKITSTINTTNIVCFDKNGKIKRYEGPEEILREFYDLRLEFYTKRKEHLITVLKHEYERLDNKAKFIQLVIDEKLQFFNRKKVDVIADMKEHGLQQIYPLKKKNALVQDDDEDPNNQAEDQEGTGYEYLFSISVSGFTREKVEELYKQRDAKLEELEDVQGTPPKTFWRRDLEALLKEWESILEEDAEYEKAAKPMATSDAGKKRKRAPVKKKVKQED